MLIANSTVVEFYCDDLKYYREIIIQFRRICSKYLELSKAHSNFSDRNKIQLWKTTLHILFLALKLFIK